MDFNQGFWFQPAPWSTGLSVLTFPIFTVLLSWVLQLVLMLRWWDCSQYLLQMYMGGLNPRMSRFVRHPQIYTHLKKYFLAASVAVFRVLYLYLCIITLNECISITLRAHKSAPSIDLKSKPGFCYHFPWKYFVELLNFHSTITC